jgi:hypothetical protein
MKAAEKAAEKVSAAKKNEKTVEKTEIADSARRKEEHEEDYNPVKDMKTRETFRWPKITRFGSSKARHEILDMHQGKPKSRILAEMRLTTDIDEVSGCLLFVKNRSI